MSETVPVLIVGGGPVGLALAIELGTRGVRCVLVERGDGSVPVPKMTQLTTRTVEFCRRWGIVDEVKAAGWPETLPGDFVYVTSLAGFELFREPYPSYAMRGEVPYSPEGTRHCPQIFFDPILRRHAATLPTVSLRYGAELESFDQDAGCVRATVRDGATGRLEVIDALYLVGCDGFDGHVRKAMGVAYAGSGMLSYSVSIYFRSPALIHRHDKGWSRFYRLVGPEGHWGDMIAIDGKELYRLTVLDANPDQPVDAFDVAACMRRAAGVDFPYDVLSVLPWKRRELVADRFRSGRVFIAGDAAHQMSPTGGLGMNTGVGDAVDLGWKLAAVLDGWGGQVLLDAYQIERKPVAVTSVTASSRVYQETMALPGGPLLLEDSSDGAAHRERFRRAFDGKRAVTEPISEQAKLGYCYDASPIVVPDGSLPISYEAPSFIPSARPGTRAPHAWVRPGISTLDYFGDGFVLLCLGVEPYDARDLQRCADERGVPFRVVEVRDPGIAKLYETALVLVRPDGHVAWRSNTPPADPGRLLDRVRGAMTNTKGDAACESPQSKATISPS